MNNTALGAKNTKKQEIVFISEAHEKFYYEQLNRVRYQDVYHKALCYCLGISDDTRRNINSIYDFKSGCVKLEKMGFSRGNVLEPSMGIGNFFGMMPDSMKESRLYGVELDSITGQRMLKAGYIESGMLNDTKLGTMQGGLCLARHNPPYDELDVMPRYV